MEMIKNVKMGDRVTMGLKFQSIQIKKTTANDDYASLIGFDSEDLIDVKIWSLSEEKKSKLRGAIKFFAGEKANMKIEVIDNF